MEIYGTLGPSCQNVEILRKMFESGMTGMRLNLSHVSLHESEKIISMYRKAAEEVGVDPKLMIDLQGPELRVGILPSPLELIEGKTVYMGGDDFPVPSVLLESLVDGTDLLLDDGSILLQTICCESTRVKCQVICGGIINSRKSIAAPSLQFNMPTLTESDLNNLNAAKEFGVTSVLQPFVRGEEDIIELRNILNGNGLSNVKVIAKIENQQGLSKLDEIIKRSDEICIARGDLGNDMPLWGLPEAQKRIAAECNQRQIPFMVVTQMLHSMITSPSPTRAEVSDIYNAVLDGATSLMLTSETAIGKYPAEAIGYLNMTARQAERYVL